MSDHDKRHKRSEWTDRALRLLLILVVGASLWFLGVNFPWTRPNDGELSLANATWALALFTLVLAIGIPLTIRASTKEREESSQQFLKQEQDRFYAQLDSTYLQIQKLIIDHPHLGTPEDLPNAPWTTAERAQYDAFAFAVWNFIESIHDFTRDRDDSAQTQQDGSLLRDTWSCIIQYEGARHAEWFRRRENQLKFKESFCDHICAQFKIPRNCTEAQTAASHVTG